MVSKLAGAAIRVVVFTPLIVGFATVAMRPQATAVAVLGGFDPVALLQVVAGLPYAPLIVLAAAGIAALNPDAADQH